MRTPTIREVVILVTFLFVVIGMGSAMVFLFSNIPITSEGNINEFPTIQPSYPAAISTTVSILALIAHFMDIVRYETMELNGFFVIVFTALPTSLNQTYGGFSAFTGLSAIPLLIFGHSALKIVSK